MEGVGLLAGRAGSASTMKEARIRVKCAQGTPRGVCKWRLSLWPRGWPPPLPSSSHFLSPAGLQIISAIATYLLAGASSKGHTELDWIAHTPTRTHPHGPQARIAAPLGAARRPHSPAPVGSRHQGAATDTVILGELLLQSYPSTLYLARLRIGQAAAAVPWEEAAAVVRVPLNAMSVARAACSFRQARHSASSMARLYRHCPPSLPFPRQRQPAHLAAGQLHGLGAPRPHPELLHTLPSPSHNPAQPLRRFAAHFFSTPRCLGAGWRPLFIRWRLQGLSRGAAALPRPRSPPRLVPGWASRGYSASRCIA